MGLCEGAERERGERSLDSVGVSLMSSGSKFVLQKNQIRPVNEAGRAEGFFPVTSCSLGKRQPESEFSFTRLGCLFAGGRAFPRPWGALPRVLTVPSALSIFSSLFSCEILSLLA